VGQGPRAGLAANLGVLAGNAVYFALSAAGLGALLLASHTLFTILKWAGAAYLVWLGIATLLGRPGGLSVAAAADGRRDWQIWRGGLLLQLANPKALLFFAALLPQFIDPAGDVVAQVAILGVTSVVVEFAVLLFYGSGAGRAGRLVRWPSLVRWLDRVAGVLLIGAGAGLAALRRAD
jgi:homoserine/homoserine lactone efflux protein